MLLLNRCITDFEILEYTVSPAHLRYTSLEEKQYVNWL